ncbi:MAG: hypothetical protein N3E49_04365 [Bacteroidia bacterium]|nr:hypothetical protein [Bacteroidia bacterium]
MKGLWLRYLRLWSVSLEARLEILLSRWAARLVGLIVIVAAGGITLLLLTAALIAWAAGTTTWSFAFLAGSGLWGAILIVSLVLGRQWIKRLLFPREALYRLQLAQSGLRLIEKSLVKSQTAPAITSIIYRYLGQIAWGAVRKWLRKWIPFL